MTEELGRIEKPLAEGFRQGRKLFFIPLVFRESEMPAEVDDKIKLYWEQVEAQIAGLEVRLGEVNKIFHELVTGEGSEALESLKQLEVSSYHFVQKRLEKGAKLQVIEDRELLTELMDWSRCLSAGLQNRKVLTRILEFYDQAVKVRNELISKKLNEMLGENETALLLMSEGHQVQFPQDVTVIYVSPPALDQLKRLIRDIQSKAGEKSQETPEQK